MQKVQNSQMKIEASVCVIQALGWPPGPLRIIAKKKKKTKNGACILLFDNKYRLTTIILL